MLACCTNPFLHHLRIIIQLITPHGLLWLIMSLKAGASFLNNFPFTGAFRPEHITKTLIMMARRPDIGCNTIFPLFAWKISALFIWKLCASFVRSFCRTGTGNLYQAN